MLDCTAGCIEEAQLYEELCGALSGMHESWRVLFAIAATAIVVSGAFLAIRFLIGFYG
ncbi:hypothetical protein NLM27_25735 [Bradyrhizobium sp. CCGB12]|uniref:hypothetical protein n=1 Tax=Bradyrhizobium sp. CCGB12 TaxID=2949632 RepID=UPI0020B38A73|nr:hypothetical protein [Bradyrhizobium sp. CCGB12]MCP3392188.1 hypothetical protein [Bradyrhizobium sp. CCGB12]